MKLPKYLIKVTTITLLAAGTTLFTAFAFYVAKPIAATLRVHPLLTAPRSTVVLTPRETADATSQKELLRFTYDVATADGHKHPELVQAILMVETKVGEHRGSGWRVAGSGPDNLYYGLGQLKVAAARDVMKKFPDLWRYCNTKTDDELKARLIIDDKFNIRVTSKYALLMGFNDDPTFGITAYNRGRDGALLVDRETWEYTLKVKESARALKKSASNVAKKVESAHPARPGTTHIATS